MSDYVLGAAVGLVGVVVLGHYAIMADFNKRLKRIEDADAEADKVVNVWYAQAETVLTDKGMES